MWLRFLYYCLLVYPLLFEVWLPILYISLNSEQFFQWYHVPYHRGAMLGVFGLLLLHALISFTVSCYAHVEYDDGNFTPIGPAFIFGQITLCTIVIMSHLVLIIYFQQGILFVGLGCSISPHRKI